MRTPCIRTSQVPFFLSLLHFGGGLAIVKVVNRARNMGGTDGPPVGPTGGVWVRRQSYYSIISPGTFDS